MANKLILDGKTYSLDEWITQVDYAELYEVKINTLCQWIKRAKEGKGNKVDYLDVPELHMTLVKK